MQVTVSGKLYFNLTVQNLASLPGRAGRIKHTLDLKDLELSKIVITESLENGYQNTVT